MALIKYNEAMILRNDVAIIGAGPAGIAAAVQLRRSGINPLVFERSRVGGLLNNAFLVENYPGFPKGISGINLVTLFKKHLKKWKIVVKKEQVFKACREKNGFIVCADKKYMANILIIATGTKPKHPKININGFEKKIFFEIYPIRNIKNKHIVIIGAGDAALDYALNLSRVNRVTILNRKKEIKGLDLLFKRVKGGRYKKHITYIPGTKLLGITQLRNDLITNLSNKGERVTLSCDYLLFAIGREPVLDFLPSSLRRKFPYEDKRLYFIGDVKHGNLRQTAIAIGDGVKAAMEIAKLK